MTQNVLKFISSKKQKEIQEEERKKNNNLIIMRQGLKKNKLRRFKDDKED